MKKIVGIQKKEGVIDGKGYVNFKYYIQDLDAKNLEGVAVDPIKIKVSTHNNLKEKGKVLGYEFEQVLYDVYKNVVDLA